VAQSDQVPVDRVRQLYNTVAVPAFTYAADVWYTGIHKPASGGKNRGSIAVTKKLTSVQRRATKLISGSLSSTAGDVMDAHTNLLPIDLLFHKILFRAAARIASLPSTHPLHALSRKAAHRYVKRHRSPLHNLFFTCKINPTSIETVNATRRRPNYIPSFTTHMEENKIAALLKAHLDFVNYPISVYSDGSGFEGGIGASAVLFIDGNESTALRFHLGSEKQHTVYEAEIVGLTLSLHLLTNLQRQLRQSTILGTDSQAAIKALDNQRPHAARYLLDHVHTAAEKLQAKQDRLRNTAARRDAKKRGEQIVYRKRGVFDLQIHWVPGHMGFEPNKRADEEAKAAAQGNSSRTQDLPVYLCWKPLPSSISALHQANLVNLQKRWKRWWCCGYR
jgi:ribonuclease HI